ncbi:hypothetical protein GCM10023185_13530 [Hymenobacter saemangeumensis]|uniref:DUF4097 domain-containing protein n=1 Tax=Hymenobacter saemangeumensis TaxID=1084522 RepID=A0ABP8I7R9_9BACT
MNLIHILLAQARHGLQPALLALLVLLAAGPAARAQNTGTDPVVVPLTSPGKPGTLRLKLVGGSINVVGHKGKDVVIDASARELKSRRERARETSDGLRRIDQAEGLEMTVEEKDNLVVIKTDSYRRPIDLTIKVPQNFSLKLGTVNSGDITVEDVNGELEISNVNGSITLRQVGGSAVVNTVNGSVLATFEKVTADAPMAFSTVNGKIDVSFPNKVKANLKLKSDQGAIYSDFDMEVAPAPRPVASTKGGGMYRVTQDSWTYGKLNGGGAEIMMKSLQGSIYVRKAK